MKYGIWDRSFSDEDLAITAASLAGVGSGIMLLDAYPMNIEEVHLASAIPDAR